MFGSRFLLTKLRKDEKDVKVAFAVVGIAFAFLTIDLIYLHLKSVEKNPEKTVSMESPLSSPTSFVSPTPSPTLTPSPLPTLPQTATQQSVVKDYFIPLGSGTSQANGWTDVQGAQAVVDFGQYGQISAIYFEASVVVPTANQSVSVQLYNVTDQHPVWNSIVTMSGGSSTAYMTSSPIVWTTGAKLYQVQMQTQLQYLTNLTLARIHVVLP